MRESSRRTCQPNVPVATVLFRARFAWPGGLFDVHGVEGDGASNTIPQMKAGAIRTVAVTSAQRVPSWPDIPKWTRVIKEAGVKIE